LEWPFDWTFDDLAAGQSGVSSAGHFGIDLDASLPENPAGNTMALPSDTSLQTFPSQAVSQSQLQELYGAPLDGLFKAPPSSSTQSRSEGDRDLH
jgi:hypothetical protein